MSELKPGDKARWKGGSYLVEVVSGPYECGGSEMYVYRLSSGTHGFGELEPLDLDGLVEKVAGALRDKFTNGVSWANVQNMAMYTVWAEDILSVVRPKVVTDNDGDVWLRRSSGLYHCGNLFFPLETVAEKFGIRGLSYE